ncbi:DUF1175 family protein [Pigmentibacter sp. JX0631]|uniref:DUF1175 family protein n=1 Tax=Pigmentibacter sp. JX0631 TaxID=2976982 RepID=UPI0024694AFC|nr:DUF1175 family protein [Pigmentibacter sp. JX0631]WGL61147.1 DUF1175 family protein [Pigmentibacter sp. JX0631]
MLRTAIVNLALYQARRISSSWLKEQQDCAGFIRFAYKEALKKRTLKQRNILQIPEKLYFPSVSEEARSLFPNFPNIWEISNSKYSSFADAENLVTYNFEYVSKNVNDLLPGDILAFNKNSNALEPWHLMLYVGKVYNKSLVMYHNGGKGKNAKIRIVSINDLLNSPDPQWLPNNRNPFFVGIYKWKMFQDIKKL